MTDHTDLYDLGDEPQSPVVVSPQVSADGRPGKIFWHDTGSGAGREVWVPDPPDLD
ncbi:immunoglobulin domain-containing family protein [Actinoplanes siamensis]|uniref:hypothetical protein n=1 Tax=Actinoplanes siamensis TaxID=1223317 RepID=UPI003606A6C7